MRRLRRTQSRHKVLQRCSKVALFVRPPSAFVHGAASSWGNMLDERRNGDFSTPGRSSPIVLQHFRYAVSAAEHGSFRRAAEALLLRQSTFSRCVRQLEEIDRPDRVRANSAAAFGRHRPAKSFCETPALFWSRWMPWRRRRIAQAEEKPSAWQSASTPRCRPEIFVRR